MPPEKTRGARPRDEGATADSIDSLDARERARRPAGFDAARATSPNAAYLRPVAPLDTAPPAQAGRPHPDSPALDDERASQRDPKPFVRGLPEDPAVAKLTAADPAARGRVLRIVAIVALAAVALWLVLS